MLTMVDSINGGISKRYQRNNASRRNALKSLRRKDVVGLILIGNEKVGKTALIKRWLYSSFPLEYVPTVEDFYVGHYSHEHRRVNVGVIDMSGSGQFPAMLELYLSQSDSIIYVYDVSDQKSMSALELHYEQVQRFLKDRTPVQSVVGTKIDTQVDIGQGYSNKIVEAFVDRLGPDTKHVLTSSKLGINIDTAFDNALREIVQTHVPSSMSMERFDDHDKPGGCICCCFM